MILGKASPFAVVCRRGRSPLAGVANSHGTVAADRGVRGGSLTADVPPRARVAIPVSNAVDERVGSFGALDQAVSVVAVREVRVRSVAPVQNRGVSRRVADDVQAARRDGGASGKAVPELKIARCSRVVADVGEAVLLEVDLLVRRVEDLEILVVRRALSGLRRYMNMGGRSVRLRSAELPGHAELGVPRMAGAHLCEEEPAGAAGCASRKLLCAYQRAAADCCQERQRASDHRR